MKYQPKRSSKRWLEGAPDVVLAIYDHGVRWPHDRYTILFGGWLWDPSMGRSVLYLAMSEDGRESSSGETPIWVRRGRKMKWSDLTPACQRAVIEFAKPDEPGHYVKTATALKHFESEFEARLYIATFKGEYQHYE